jgi:hypothetical protein
MRFGIRTWKNSSMRMITSDPGIKNASLRGPAMASVPSSSPSVFSSTGETDAPVSGSILKRTVSTRLCV